MVFRGITRNRRKPDVYDNVLESSRGIFLLD